MTVVVGSLHHVHTYCIRMSIIKMISGQLLAISHLCGLSHHYDSFLILAQISLLVLWLCLIAGECKILVLNLESHTLPYFHYITLLPCFYIAIWHWQFIFFHFASLFRFHLSLLHISIKLLSKRLFAAIVL